MAPQDDASLGSEVSRRIRRAALDLGFDRVGICNLAPVPHAEALDRWLRAGMAGTMGYMGRQAARRKEPARVFEGARSAIVVAVNYFEDSTDSNTQSGAMVARYARGEDYHTTLGNRLRELREGIVSICGAETIARHYVDAGPVPERELGQRAGIGWIGKNTMLIDPSMGSFFFIGSVLVDRALEADRAFTFDRCGTCTRCIDACPTDAIVEPRVLDSRRCISYVTIESKQDVPEALAPMIGNWVFGCDICQDVCPWNESFAGNLPVANWLGHDERMAALDAEELMRMDEATFGSRYGTTPFERPGLAGLRRNVKVVRSNLGEEQE